MSKRLQVLWLVLALSWVAAVPGAISVYQFPDTGQEHRFKGLINELRCLVCQNQSLADSNAELAQDLRQEVYEMVTAGKSDEEILKFLVDRYGDFVLYRPPVETTTYLLWFGPFLALLVGLAVLIRIVRKRATQAAGALSAEEQLRLHQALDQLKGND
jgi:cytochrome c-type biogenesis protein CcmH